MMDCARSINDKIDIWKQLLGPGGVFPTPPPYDNTSGEKAGDGRRNTRGIYAQLPRGAEDANRVPLREQPGAHFDSAPVDDSMTHGRFMVTGLIADTPESCPGFTLWPRSAPRLYALALELRRKGTAPDSDEARTQLDALIQTITEDTEPVAVHGDAGTVVFWHRACLHSVGANYSGVIRQAIIYDFPAASAAPLSEPASHNDYGRSFDWLEAARARDGPRRCTSIAHQI